MGLVKEVEAILRQFRPVFKRRAAFGWFVLVAWAFMLRMEAFGVTSVVRCLGLAPAEYHNLLHFFHSTAFSVQALCARWTEIVKNSTRRITVGDMPVHVADGIKFGKAGQKMPAVKLLHQESNDNTKPEYIMGHFWGAASVLVDAGRHVLAIPLRFQIQDGIKRSPTDSETLIDKMRALVIAVVAPGSLLVADASYTSAAFMRALLDAGVHYVGRMRSNAIAYTPARRFGPPRRGRPRKYGKRIQLRELFERPERFRLATVDLDGDLKNVRYRCLDLFWHGLLLRFVLSIYPDGRRRILVSTKRELSPEEILYAYGLRFKIEVSFKALVEILSGFCYHFWMKAMEKRPRGAGNLYLHRAGDAIRAQTWRKIEAYERFVNISAIALGILQVLAATSANRIWERFPLWLRTLPKHRCPSENVVRLTLQHDLHRISLTSRRGLLLTEILDEKKRDRRGADHPAAIAA